MRKLRATVLAALVVAGSQFLSSLATAAGDWTWPVRGEVITFYRNGDDPYAAGQHRGIDIAAPVGEPVVAAATGRVGFAGLAGSSGLTVSVRTADGRFDTSYLHLSAIDVREGERVRAGERLGAVGTTGRRSAQPPHLHFGVREAGRRHAYLDPLDFLPPPPAGPRPERPPGAPVPVRSPVSRVPAPAPVLVPTPALRPISVPRPGPRAVPTPAPRGVPTQAPRSTPLPLPTRTSRPEPRGDPARRPFSAEAPRAAPAGAPSPSTLREPGLAPELGPAPGAHRPPAAVPPAQRPATRVTPDGGGRLHEPGGGFDLGWALACAGLALAATGLGGRRGHGTKARERGAPGSPLGGLLRPLFGRG